MTKTLREGIVRSIRNEEEWHNQSKDHQPLDTPESTYNDHKTNQGLISYSVATSPMMYELAFGLARTLFFRP